MGNLINGRYSISSELKELDEDEVIRALAEKLAKPQELSSTELSLLILALNSYRQLESIDGVARVIC